MAGRMLECREYMSILTIFQTAVEGEPNKRPDESLHNNILPGGRMLFGKDVLKKNHFPGL